MTERNTGHIVSEMDEKMRTDAIAQANLAIDSKHTEKEISEMIKSFFDRKYEPNWHCVVGKLALSSQGKNFSSFFSYKSKHFIFFYIGQNAILLYKL